MANLSGRPDVYVDSGFLLHYDGASLKKPAGSYWAADFSYGGMNENQITLIDDYSLCARIRRL